MKKITLLLFLIISNFYLLIAQPIQWQKCLGGTNDEFAWSIQQTIDGGYIVAGYTQSNDGDVFGFHGGSDFWIVRLDNLGIIQWQKCLGGTGGEVANSIQQTADSGYIVAGSTTSNDGDVSGNHGHNDFWIVKLDSLGLIQWQKCLGGSDREVANSIQQTIDGGYIVAGTTASNNGDVSGNHGIGIDNYDFWIVKLDSLGLIQWQKCLGGTVDGDIAKSIQQTKDGGFIVAGTTNSNDGDVSGNHSSSKDCWIVRLDSLGVIIWQKCLGGTSWDISNSIQQTTDGGYIVAGYTMSNDSNVSGNHGYYDSWIVKLDSLGLIQWQKCLGGTQEENANSIQQTTDGGYIIAGITLSNDGDVSGYHGIFGFHNYDSWIVKLDSLGIFQWQKCLGGSGANGDYAESIQQTTDGGYIFAGGTVSNDGDVSGNHGYGDYWVVKLSTTVDINESQNQITDFQIIPNPLSSSTIISFQCSFSTKINLVIRDIEGRIIKNFTANNFKVGTNEFVWDATNNSGSKVDNGLYFFTIVSNYFTETKKGLVLKN